MHNDLLDALETALANRSLFETEQVCGRLAGELLRLKLAPGELNEVTLRLRGLFVRASGQHYSGLKRAQEVRATLKQTLSTLVVRAQPQTAE